MALALESLQSFRAVVIQGARQVGKSTLAEQVASGIGAEVVSLDDEAMLQQATDDPALFLSSLGRPVVIDEWQRAGQPFVLAMKRQLDRSRVPGQFVLTGSTNFLTSPRIAESLAGRVDLITLWPLSVGEAIEGADGFVERGLTGVDALRSHRGATPSRGEYLDRLCAGGYPEVQRLDGAARRRWFDRYLETVLRREVETVADLRRFDALVAMARLLLSTTGSELVTTGLARSLAIDRATAETYEPWIESTFLVHRVPAWSRNVAAKVVHRPKLHACDTGLAAATAGKDATALARLNDTSVGPLVESFVVAELAKQLSWSRLGARLYHHRERGGLEVDALVEAPDGRVLAVEIKANTVARPADAAPMAALRDRLDRVGDDFVAGVVFHTGSARASLGDRLLGLPIADLWT